MSSENDRDRIIELKLISAASPSIAETLRNYPLQAALYRISNTRGSILVVVQPDNLVC